MQTIKCLLITINQTEPSIYIHRAIFSAKLDGLGRAYVQTKALNAQLLRKP